VSAKRVSIVACFCGWLATRALLSYAIANGLFLGPGHKVLGDLVLYRRWGTALVHGQGLPVADEAWQYPPGAGAVFMAPLALPASYRLGFMAVMLVADAATFCLLLVRRESTVGAWLWTLGGIALGPLLLARFDAVPTSLAVAGLITEIRLLAGANFALGAWVKVWPALLVLRGPTPRTTALAVTGAGGVVLAGLGVLALTGSLPRAFDFLTEQGQRGLQLESVAATPLLLYDALVTKPAATYRVVFDYGALQVTGPGTRTAVLVCTLASLAVVGWYLVSTVQGWRRGDSPARSLWRALTLVLLLMVTSRVLSPQYMVWALGVGGVVAARGLRRARVVAALVLLAAALTQWLFPFHYAELRSREVGATLVIAVRNGLLIAAATVSVWAASRGCSERSPAPDRLAAPEPSPATARP